MKKGFAKYTEKELLPGMKKQAGQAGADGNIELRTRIVQVAYSPSEFKKLTDLYSKSPCSTMASYCREKSLSKSPRTDNKNDLKIVYFSYDAKLAGIGNNLNQIARRLNEFSVILKKHGALAHENEKEIFQLMRDLRKNADEFRGYKESIFNKMLKGD